MAMQPASGISASLPFRRVMYPKMSRLPQRSFWTHFPSRQWASRIHACCPVGMMPRRNGSILVKGQYIHAIQNRQSSVCIVQITQMCVKDIPLHQMLSARLCELRSLAQHELWREIDSHNVVSKLQNAFVWSSSGLQGGVFGSTRIVCLTS